MSYKIEIQGKFLVVTDTVTGIEQIREPRDQVKFKVIGTEYSFHFNKPSDNLTGKDLGIGYDVTAFDFGDIVDSNLIAFIDQDTFNLWLSENISIVCCSTEIISQTITDGVTNKAPSEDAVFDALSQKLDITALPSNLTLYPTSTASDIGGYFKIVTSLSDPDYDNPAVDFTTTAISGSGILLGELATTAGILSGNPGILNVVTLGNIKKDSGSGNAEFYFEIYHRDSLGTETLIGTSSTTGVVTTSTYEEFSADMMFNNGVFTATDRIVLKWYGSKIGGGSNPVYSFQLGGSAPVRTIVPVPASVILDVPIQIDVTEIIDGTVGTLLRNEGGKVGDTNYTVPKTDGTAGQVLTTNGAGSATWATLSTGITIGTTAIAGGTVGRVLFEGVGNVLSESDGLLYNPTTKRFGVGGNAALNGVLSAVTGFCDMRFSTGIVSSTPTLSVIQTDASGKAVALAAGTGASVLAYSTSGAFLIIGEPKTNFTSNNIGAGTVFARFETDGKMAVGANAAGAKLDVQAQGALSTDIAFRVRNSANTDNLIESRGNGELIVKNINFAPVLRAQSSLDTFLVGQSISYQRSVTSGDLEFLLQNGATGGKVKFKSSGSTIYQLEDVFTGRHDTANLSLFTNSAISTNGYKVLNISSGSAPTVTLGGADFFSIYSADIVAGNAAPHFRTENGDVVKAYSIGGWGTPTGTLTRTTFDTTTVTLSELAERVAALISDLKTGHGLLKA